MHFHAPADPRLVISVIGGKPVTVVVHLPTLWGMIPLTCAGTVTRGQFARRGAITSAARSSTRRHDDILITARAAPSGSARTAKRPGGMSVGGTSVVAPSSAALVTEASVSSTPK
jgi:hypothetical protein